MQTQTSKPTKWAWIALASVSFFWGTTYFFIKIAGQYLPAFFFSGSRHVIAGVLMLTYFIGIKKLPIPPSKTLFKLFGIGLLLILGANVLLVNAEHYVSSGLAALLCAFLPFNILIINAISGNSERISKTTLVGFLLGIVGMILIFYESLVDLNNAAILPGIILVCIGNFSWALGSIATKKTALQIAPFYGAAWQFVLTGSFILLLSVFFDDWSTIQWNPDAIGAFAYLVVFGSIIGFGSFAYAITHLPATISSVYAYINPLVAVLLGFVFLSEPVSQYTLAAMAVTLAGVYFVNKGYRN